MKEIMDETKECKPQSVKSKLTASKKDIDFQNSNSIAKDMKHLKNLEDCYIELKNIATKTRKSYSTFKLSTYFLGDREFTNNFGGLLSEVENTMDKMSEAFKKTQTNSIVNVKKELFKKSSENNDLSSIPDGILEHSLTPPPSEIGNEQVSISSSRKRKKKGDLSSIKKAKKTTSNQDCIRTSPSKENEEKHDKCLPAKQLQNNAREESTRKDAEKKPEEEEYEVDIIKDFVRKKGNEYFHVSWKGYDSDDDTFEPVAHLFGCDDIMEKFFMKRIEHRNVCETVDEFKALQFPMDISVKEVLFNAYQKFAEVDVKEVIKISTALKMVTKTKEELEELVYKVSAFRESSLAKYRKLFNNLKMHLALFHIHPERERQLALLRAWERSINTICSDPSPLTVENNSDLDLPPLDFVYVNHQQAGQNICIPEDPMIGCKCTDCHSNQNNCCPKGMESHFSYTKFGRLKVSLGTPIYECNKLCSCSQDCPNRVVQKGRRIPMTIFRTANGRGWGVRAQEFIRKDTFVTEYVGEVISSEEAEQRGMKYDAKGCTYLFDLDYNKGDLNPYTIDAAKYGNVSHFINHSCDPSLVVFNVWVNCLDPDLPRLALFANRDVRKGEELTFDYNSGSTRHQFEAILKEDIMTSPEKGDANEEKLQSPVSARKNRQAGTTKCLCGAANCRQYFF